MVKNPSGEASNVGYFTSAAEDFISGLPREQIQPAVRAGLGLGASGGEL